MDPATFTAAATAAGATLDFAGGLFGSSASKGESRNNRREARRQFDAQMDYQKNATQYRVQDAIKAGVNPLAALGTSGGTVSPTISAGYGDGGASQIANAFSSAGDRLSRALSSIASKQQLESNDLDLEAKRLQIQILQGQLDHLNQPGVPQPVDDPITVAQVALNPDQYSVSDIGQPQRASRLLKKWVDPNGRLVEIIDPDAVPDAEIDNLEAWHALGLAYPAKFVNWRHRSSDRAIDARFGKGTSTRLKRKVGYYYNKGH